MTAETSGRRTLDRLRCERPLDRVQDTLQHANPSARHAPTRPAIPE